MIHEWQIVFGGGIVFGWFARGFYARLVHRRADEEHYKGRWPALLLAALLGQGCL